MAGDEVKLKRHRRRWPWLLAAPFTLALLAVGLLLFLLATGIGHSLAARKILDAVNGAFQGRIRVGAARFTPDGHFTAQDVTILGPRGDVILRAASVETWVDLPALAHERLHFTHTRVSGGGLWLMLDAQGNVNVADAFSPKQPTPPRTATPGTGGLSVDVDGADVEADVVTLALASGATALDLRQVRIDGGRFTLGTDLSLRAEANALRADAAAPFAGKLGLSSPALQLDGTRLRATAGVAFDDARGEASAELDVTALSGNAELRELRAGPEVLARWLPELAPKELEGEASVTLNGKTLTLVSLRVVPAHGPGELRASGTLDLQTGTLQATVAGKALDAQAFFGQLPTSVVGFDITAHGDGLFGDSRTLSTHVQLAKGTVEGQPIGPGTADARLAGKALDLTALDVAIPGGHVHGKGTLDLASNAVKADAQIDAWDLHSLRAAFDDLLGTHLPAFAGQLTARAQIAGPLDAPALQAQMNGPHLAIGGFEATDLQANLDADRLGRHMDLRGTVAVAELHLPDRTLRDLGAAVDWTTPDLHVDVHAQEGTIPLQVAADLRMPAGVTRAELWSLQLHAAQSDWYLAAPVPIDIEGGVSIGPLDLRSPPQRLSVALALADGSLKLSAHIEALDLGQLPAALLPSVPLSGQLEGFAEYTERKNARTASADLTLHQVVIRSLAIPSGHLRGRLVGSQISVDLSATLQHGGLSIQGTVPLPGEPGKIDVDLQTTGVALDDFAPFVPPLRDLHAAVSLRGHLAGDWTAPHANLTATATGITGGWTTDPNAGPLAAPLDANVALVLDDSGLREDLHVAAKGTPLLDVTGKLPFPARKIGAGIKGPAALGRELLSQPVDVQLALAEVPLGPIASSVRGAPELSGKLSAKGWVRGPLRTPRGALTLQGRALAYDRKALGDLTLALNTSDSSLRGTAELRPPEGQLTATAEWQLAPESLGDPTARDAARLTADVRASGLPLTLLFATPSPLRGFIDLTGSFRGDLLRPAAHATAALRDLKLHDEPLGTLAAKADWDGGRLVASLDGSQPRGGTLDAHAELPFRLRGSAAGEPLSANLDANRFDLAPLGPFVAGSGTLRKIAGTLDARLALGGTLEAPVPSGTLDITGGTVALAGLGQLNEVAAQVALSSDGLALRKLSGKAASGTFLAQGSVDRGDSGYDVQIHLGTQKLGVVADDRLLGFLTSSEALTGSLGKKAAHLTLAIQRARFDLPSLTPKATGPTALDPDIVEGNTKKAAAAHDPAAYALQLDIDSQKELELKAQDLDLQARVAMTIAVQGDTQIKGGVTATGGRINAYGRRLSLEYARVTFGHGDTFGPAGPPAVEARATQNIGAYKLFIDVSGVPPHLQIATSSEPPLDKEKVGLLLVTGSAEGIESGPGASSGPAPGGLVAASALGGYLTEQLRASLGPYMPLDQLTFEPNRLEAGKFVTKRLYVGVVDNLGVTDPRINGTEVHANYRLTSRWSLDSRYGTAQAGDLDLKWTHSW